MTIQQTWVHRIVSVIIQGHYKIKKTHGDKVHKNQKEQNTAEKQPSTPPKAKKYKPMDSDEHDEETQNERGTSSNSQTTVPVLPLQQGPAASSQGPATSSQGPAASANSEGEDSEYSDE